MRTSLPYNGNPLTGKTTPLYWNNPYSLALRQGDQLKDHTSTIKPKLILVSCFIMIFLLWCMGLLSISSMQELLWIIPWILPMVYESQQSLCSYQSVVLIPYYAPEVSDIKKNNSIIFWCAMINCKISSTGLKHIVLVICKGFNL